MANIVKYTEIINEVAQIGQLSPSQLKHYEDLEKLHLIYLELGKTITKNFSYYQRCYPFYFILNNPKKAVVYFIQDSHTKLVKIGYTIDLKSRHQAIQRGLLRDTKLLGVINCHKEIVKEMEKEMHSEFKSRWKRDEWFSLSQKDVDLMVKIYNDNYQYLVFCNEHCDCFSLEDSGSLLYALNGGFNDCNWKILMDSQNEFMSKIEKFKEWLKAENAESLDSLCWISTELYLKDQKWRDLDKKQIRFTGRIPLHLQSAVADGF